MSSFSVKPLSKPVTRQDDLAPANAACEESPVEILLKMAVENGEEDVFSGKRSTPRYNFGVPLDVSLDPDTSSDSWPVVMHNVSGSGVAFWSRRALQMHAPIFVRYHIDGEASPWLRAKVVHVTVGIRGHLVGIRLEESKNTKS
jgi:hypothetical protein